MIIAHISDIHIRRNKRHEEYRVVLSNLISSLESFSIDRIVVAGDVIHNKRELSPELIQLTVDYLDGLRDYCRTYDNKEEWVEKYLEIYNS